MKERKNQVARFHTLFAAEDGRLVAISDITERKILNVIEAYADLQTVLGSKGFVTEVHEISFAKSGYKLVVHSTHQELLDDSRVVAYIYKYDILELIEAALQYVNAGGRCSDQVRSMQERARTLLYGTPEGAPN